jgi:hypothetical protein
VGATLTNAGTQAALVIDGITLSVDDRVLVYEQADATQNGVYTVTNVGSVSTNWVMTRSTDTDSYGNADGTTLDEGSYFFVQEGVTGAGESYVCNTVGTITFGTTNITFIQFSNSIAYTAGTGININSSRVISTSAVATDAQVATLSATMATSIANVSATLETRIATVSSTMATSINNVSVTLESRIAIVSSTMATSISNVSSTLESRIGTVSSTMATSIANVSSTLESRIGTVSSTMATSIANVSSTLESRIATVSSTMATSIANVSATLNTRIIEVEAAAVAFAIALG